MGKIIDRVRERQDKQAKAHQREWIADAERMQREANDRAMQMWSAQRNVEAECNSLASMLSLNAQIETSAAIMAGLQNSEEAKRWNAQSVEQPQHSAPARWWQFWR